MLAQQTEDNLEQNRFNKKSFERWLTKAWLSYEIKTIHILQFDFYQIEMSTKRSEGMIRRTKKTNDSKKKFVVEQLLLLHNWVVASIGDLKLLALFGVLVLKSFFLPMNIKVYLVELLSHHLIVQCRILGHTNNSHLWFLWLQAQITQI